ncbi:MULTISPECIES: 3-oxoacyl-ACP synthase III family protein [Streptomyces]|uniref:3-oxoacyl-ACP synthase III family protein n=1 Tax=Streptomyces TaxID=1883 RepID=UPI001E3A2268|nr:MULTISPECIES: 3-oxoacyl-[acyl-carrier-protein] synthase III C-terminal domain-containing protein [Streptomyces]UFQ19070.1 3-oxoacyl-ACP synthase [Streptomyces huasconensis]WCL88689.1 3-oxoacyl-[acyl-carrier-protein] synthase III C-terminal domain-containing protein [Streptomyces sp. JCM 35825]
MNPPVTLGIASLAHVLGEPRDVAETAGSYVDDPERVIRWGYRTYHRAAPGVGQTRMAADAARRALDAVGLSASDIDYLVVADSGVPEYLNWDASAAVARELQLGSTPTLLATQGCASAVTALQQIAGLMAVRDDIQRVLLVAVHRVSEAHINRMRNNTCLGSDGAAAAVVQRGHDRLRWLATDQIVDPRYVDFFRVEYGGSAAPTGANLEVDQLALVHQYFRREPEQLAQFVKDVDHQVAAVVERACERAGVPTSEISRLIYLNDNQHSLAGVAKTTGVPLERTNAALSAELSHVGCADQLLCLSIYQERGDLAPGDLVALAGLSGGMQWFCSLVRV